MNHTICPILLAHLFDKDQEHWPDYVAVIEMAINESILKTPFEVLYSENTLFPVELLLSREPSLNSYTHKFSSKMQQLVDKVKCAMHDA